MIDANGHGGSHRKSAKKVEGVEDVICVDSAMESLPDLCPTKINLDTTNFSNSEKTEFELTVRGFTQNDNAGYAYSPVPRLAGNQDQTTDTGDRGATKKEIEGVPLSVSNGIGLENSGLMLGASGSYQQQPLQNQQQPPQNQWPFAMFQPQQQLSQPLQQPLQQPHSNQGSAAANSNGRASSGSEGGGGSGGGNAWIFADGVENTSLLEMLMDPTVGRSGNEGV